MTELEHAIKHIKTRADAWAVKEVTEALRSISERLDKALSQELCTDAVSREAVIKLFNGNIGSESALILHMVKQLPSVNPQPCDDAISREEVLECLNDKQMELDGYGDTASAMEIARVRMTINDLPSVTSKPIECDDAISRDAVLNAIEHEDKWLLFAKGHNGLTEMAFSGLKARVDALPSVTQKSGEWIKDECGNVICSECKRFRRDCRYGHINYCNHCGCRMVEPQESEE